PEKDLKDKTEKAETRIKDWLVECHYHTEVRKVLEDSAIVGVGILKGPVPTLRRSKKVQQDENDETAMVIVEETVPASFRVVPEDFFPDPACGEDIHDGNYIFERDTLSKKRLLELKSAEGYLSDQIDKVIDEGPGKQNYSDEIRNDNKTDDKDIFEVWYFYGMVDVDDLDAMDVSGLKPESEKNLVPAIVTLINDTPIKAFLNPDDMGDFPYDVVPWQNVQGCWYGIGIARQGRTPQDMFNASGRALMDNSGLSASPMLVVRDRDIRPADGSWGLNRGKIWLATENADMRSIKDVFHAVNIPSMQAELLGNMQEARRMMEEVTGIYFIMQGQQGDAPDTVGGMQILNRNSFVFFRRFARVFDGCITEPHIRRYYEWLMEYGEDDEKGDMQIEAIGSTALVEREIYAMQAMGMLQLSLNPAFGLDPEKASDEVLKAQRFNPDKWKLDDEKKAQMAQQPPPPVPQVEAARIRAETDLRQTKMNNDLKAYAIKQDTDRDTVYSAGIARRDKTNAQLKLQELMLRKDLAILEHSSKSGMSLDKIKADLAQTAMKLNLQERLSTSGIGGEVLKPPVEPAGRAPDGKSFQY
ncbi:MAG: hypothetical protein U9N58_04575, partial [Thermodesulfobacteriota bacterium]|nr:hypothetical protein [Thermodesulfobacteriota bacterium]